MSISCLSCVLCLSSVCAIICTTRQEALSGRAHTTMLATISPSSNNYVETMNTLKYAERLRRASAHLNKDANGPPIGKVKITHATAGVPLIFFSEVFFSLQDTYMPHLKQIYTILVHLMKV